MDMAISRLAVWGMRLAIVALVLLAASALANRLGIVHFRLALQGLALAALAGLVAALVSLGGIASALSGGRAGVLPGLIGLVLGLLAAAPAGLGMVAGAKVPRIHDISTDLSNPPQFDELAGMRGADANPLDRREPANLADLQRQAYPDLQTLMVTGQPGRVFEAARQTAHDMGWTMMGSTPEKGLIEATATTALMGFKDDIVIRVAEREGRVAVDVRSVSRVGISDLGTNTKRIRAYLAALKAELEKSGGG